MDDWAKQQRTSTVYNTTEGYPEAVWGQAKNKDTDLVLCFDKINEATQTKVDTNNKGI